MKTKYSVSQQSPLIVILILVGRGETYIHLLVIKVSNIIGEMCFETPSDICSTGVFAAKKGIVASGTVDSSSFGYVVHVTEDGNIDWLFGITTVVQCQLGKGEDLLSVLKRAAAKAKIRFLESSALSRLAENE